MATKTLGTTTTAVLTAISAAPASNVALSDYAEGNFANVSAADFATVQELILNDKVGSHPQYPGALARNGLLYIPNRGVLKIMPGDFIGVDASGWPILVSNRAITFGSSSWVHT